jgi:c-di-GMP-binding flagellar brake protein YcgR
MTTAWKPAPGQVALIEMADDAEHCLTGVVMSDSNGTVSIDLGASPTAPETEIEVIASFFTPEALYRVKAHATPRREQKKVIDLTVDDVERVQRRAVPRTRIELRAALTAFEGDSDFASVVGRTVDIGPGGCRVRTEKQFPPGNDPTVTIQLPDGDTLALFAQVLQVQADDGAFEYRLAFMDVDDEDGKKLLALG